MAEIVLAGADLVLPDRVLTAGTLIVDSGRIAEIRAGATQAAPALGAALHGHLIVPGFVDAHVHGVDGIDTLDTGETVLEIAVRLPRYGVTAFSPTCATCAPLLLSRFLGQVRAAREMPQPGAARVLPAHVEGPFLHPDYAGAQDPAWLRDAARALDARAAAPAQAEEEILPALEQGAPDVATVTLAPERPGGLRLVEWLARRGIRPAMGHSAATYDEAIGAIRAGVVRVTHLFNCMPPLGHREPGLAGAALQSPDVTVEIIADGVHVHPAVVRLAVAAKGSAHVMAVTDGTSCSGRGSASGRLGGRAIEVRDGAARLPDGRMAGSVATMDRVFRTLAGPVGIPIVEAALMCATTPSRAIGVAGGGALVRDGVADFVVLDRQLEVVQTYVGGQLAYSRGGSGVA